MLQTQGWIFFFRPLPFMARGNFFFLKTSYPLWKSNGASLSCPSNTAMGDQLHKPLVHWDLSITRFCPVLSWHLLFWIRFYCCVLFFTVPRSYFWKSARHKFTKKKVECPPPGMCDLLLIESCLDNEFTLENDMNPPWYYWLYAGGRDLFSEAWGGGMKCLCKSLKLSTDFMGWGPGVCSRALVGSKGRSPGSCKVWQQFNAKILSKFVLF